MGPDGGVDPERGGLPPSRDDVNVDVAAVAQKVAGRGARAMPPDVSWQPTLFGGSTVDFDRRYESVQRIALDRESWVDHAPGWIRGADGLFRQILEGRRWQQRSRRLFDREVVEPRLTSLWREEDGLPLEPGALEEIRAALGARYGLRFDSVGFNLYRDGRDSVAWHGDRIRRELARPVVALVSLGEPRRFLLRPRKGGRSRGFHLGHGDLLVTGGRTQRTWQHCIPKVARAGPRISLAFRHGLDPSGYGKVLPGDVTPGIPGARD